MEIRVCDKCGAVREYRKEINRVAVRINNVEQEYDLCEICFDRFKNRLTKNGNFVDTFRREANRLEFKTT